MDTISSAWDYINPSSTSNPNSGGSGEEGWGYTPYTATDTGTPSVYSGGGGSGGSWYSNILSSLGSSLAKNTGSVLPMAAMMMLGSNGSGTGQSQVSQSSTQYGYPAAALINNQRNTGTAQAGAARSNAYENLARSLSIRGIGPNSPYSGGKASQIEGSYLDSLSGLNSALIKSANTPIGPIGTTTTTESSGAPSTNPLAMALGMMSYKMGSGGNNQQKNWWEM
jgi:hypothetical protein